MSRHTKGDILPIYQKPITKEDYEGHARLEKFLGHDEGLERWLVRFVVDGRMGGYEAQTYQRFL